LCILVSCTNVENVDKLLHRVPQQKLLVKTNFLTTMFDNDPTCNTYLEAMTVSIPNMYIILVKTSVGKKKNIFLNFS
jgi:hypothetical protein